MYLPSLLPKLQLNWVQCSLFYLPGFCKHSLVLFSLDPDSQYCTTLQCSTLSITSIEGLQCGVSCNTVLNVFSQSYYSAVHCAIQCKVQYHSMTYYCAAYCNTLYNLLRLYYNTVYCSELGTVEDIDEGLWHQTFSFPFLADCHLATILNKMQGFYPG